MKAQIITLLDRATAMILARPPVTPRRKVESLDNFAALRVRLDRENQLHALMLSQRHFRKANS